MHERNKYFEIHALKDTWGKTTGTFSWICVYYCVRFMRYIFITSDQIFSNLTVISNNIFRKAMWQKLPLSMLCWLYNKAMYMTSLKYVPL